MSKFQSKIPSADWDRALEGGLNAFPASKLVALYSVPVEFVAGKTTVSNSAIKANSVCFAQRRAEIPDMGVPLTTHSQAGSVVICGPSSLVGSISLNILIINP